MKTVFSDRAFASVLAETTEKIKTETGGLFLGKVIGDTWYIVEAIDPGPKSIFEVAYFEYDQKYTQHLINKIANLYDASLDLIGLWHRHPGSFDQFSSTDDGTNIKYASMRGEGAISALVNIDPDFRLTVYHVDGHCRYRSIKYEVGDSLIPPELLKFKSPERFGKIMNSMLSPQSAKREERSRGVSLLSFMELVIPAMSELECDEPLICDLAGSYENQMKLTEEILEDVSFLADRLGIETSVTVDIDYIVVYQETFRGATELLFTVSIDADYFILSYNGQFFKYRSGLLRDTYNDVKSQKPRDGGKIKRKNSVFDSVMRMISSDDD